MAAIHDQKAKTDAPKNVLLRGLVLLEALNRGQVSRLEVLAHATSLPKPTVNRMLAVLSDAGYVRRLPKRRGYTVDERVLRLSRGYRLEDAIVKAAIPMLAAFTTRYKWPVAIGTRDGASMRVREASLSISPLSAGGDEMLIGRRIGFFHSALGRAYVGFCSDEERKEILAQFDGAARQGREQGVKPQEAARIVKQVARAGYAISPPIPGDPAVGLAVPIYCGGRVAACLSLRYLGRAITRDEVVRRYLAPLRRAAAEIASGGKHSQV